MVHTIEVEIDEAGTVHPVSAGTKLPPGRAVLAWQDEQEDTALLLAEPALADWLRPEEDAAWGEWRQGK